MLRHCSDPPRPQRISIDRDRFRRPVPVDEKPASGWTRRADRFPGKRLTRRFRPKPMRRPSTASLPSGEGCDPRNGHRTDGRTRRSKPNEEQPLGGHPPGRSPRPVNPLATRGSFDEPPRRRDFHAFACNQSIAKRKSTLQARIQSNCKKVVYNLIVISHEAHNLSTDRFTLCLSCHLNYIDHKMC